MAVGLKSGRIVDCLPYVADGTGMVPKQPSGSEQTTVHQPAAVPNEVFQKESLKIGSFAKFITVLYVTVVVLFPPVPVFGGFGTLGHLIWIGLAILGAIPFIALMTFGAFFAFGRSSRAGNIAFCTVLILDFFSVLTMPMTLMGLVKAREAARAHKAQASGQWTPAASRPVSSKPTAPATRTDRPPPVIKVRKSGS
jgi:hypothetical protein